MRSTTTQTPRKDTTIGVRLSNETAEKIKAIAASNHRSASAEILRLIDLRIAEVSDDLEQAA